MIATKRANPKVIVITFTKRNTHAHIIITARESALKVDWDKNYLKKKKKKKIPCHTGVNIEI